MARSLSVAFVGISAVALSVVGISSVLAHPTNHSNARAVSDSYRARAGQPLTVGGDGVLRNDRGTSPPSSTTPSPNTGR